MKNKLPKIKTNKRVCIVCEGDEEFAYISKLKQLKVFSNKLTINPLNADGISKIFDMYSNAYQSDNYDLVVIFCDTDNNPFIQYKDLKKQVKDFHGLNKNTDVLDLICFGNPCTMQIILSHFNNVKLKSRLKSVNAMIIKNLTGVDDYRATKHQIDCIMKKITLHNFQTMKCNLNDISQQDTTTPSTNFLKMLSNLESDDYQWIESINLKL